MSNNSDAWISQSTVRVETPPPKKIIAKKLFNAAELEDDLDISIEEPKVPIKKQSTKKVEEPKIEVISPLKPVLEEPKQINNSTIISCVPSTYNSKLS